MQPVLGQDPASTMIRRVAMQQWRLIAMNVGSSVIQAFTEGLTLAVVFLSVEVLSTPVAGFNWDANPLVGWWPAAVDWLTGLPTTAVFLSLLVLAVLIQALQSVRSFLNKVSVGYFSARLTALMTTRIHSQVLSFSFPCAGSYRVGDLTRHANRVGRYSPADRNNQHAVGECVDGSHLPGGAGWNLAMAASGSAADGKYDHAVAEMLGAADPVWLKGIEPSFG